MTNEKLREAGRKGGIRSGEARRKRRDRGFLDAARALVRSDPERLVEQLAASPAGAVKLVAILERQGILEPEPKPEPVPMPATIDDRAPVTLREVLAFARSIDALDKLGLDELGVAVEAEGEGAAENRRSPGASAGRSVTTKNADRPPQNPTRDPDATIQPAASNVPARGTIPAQPTPTPKPTLARCRVCSFNYPAHKLSNNLCSDCREQAPERLREWLGSSYFEVRL